MDGSEGGMKPGAATHRSSLRVLLSLWLSATILATAFIAGTFSYFSARKAANEFLDDHLRQVATLANQSRLSLAENPAVIREDLLDPEDSAMLVQMLGEPLTAVPHKAPDLPILPTDLPDGMHTRILASEEWRIFVYTLNTGSRVAVAQRMRERDEIAHESAVDTILPLLLLIPALGVLVALVIPRLLHKVVALSRHLDMRSESDLGALDDEGIPQEILPLTRSISRLLQRVERAVHMQRRFIADAAHELRSPLTALMLQAERLERSKLPPEARPQMDALNQGLRRARALLDQLLSHARSQTTQDKRHPVSLHGIFRQTIEDYASQAEDKEIDLGVCEEPDVCIEASEVDLHALVRNLVDNAIRYCPPGSTVDLAASAQRNHALIEVRDNGPGIPDHERERVLEPFYRIVGTEATGSGLGLAIVKNIVDRLGGTLSLQPASDDTAHPGLKVLVRIPGGKTTD